MRSGARSSGSSAARSGRGHRRSSRSCHSHSRSRRPVTAGGVSGRRQPPRAVDAERHARAARIPPAGSRRRQTRFYAACLRGQIGGGVALASCPPALCQLARAHMPNCLGRLPEDVLRHIGWLAFGARNPHVDALKRAAKRPLVKRVDEDAVYEYYVHDREGRHCSPYARIEGIDERGVIVSPNDHARRAEPVTCLRPPLHEAVYWGLMRELENKMQCVQLTVQAETMRLLLKDDEYPEWRGAAPPRGARTLWPNFPRSRLAS